MTNHARPATQAIFALAALSLSLACDSGSPPAADAGPDPATLRPEPSENFARDILRYDLEINLAEQTGSVTLSVAGDASTGLSLDVGNLVVQSVSDSYGPLNHIDLGRTLNIGVPPGGDERTLTIAYEFTSHRDFNGWMEEQEVTFLWPAFCGNLYPCNPNPADGATFTMNVSGASGTAVYPTTIPADAPTYMPAIAVGDFTEMPLGTTPAGTDVSVWFEPGQEADAIAGTANLVDVFDFLETTYGPYTYGSKVGTVSAEWGGGGFGGMEHHPLWHVATNSLADEETNAHEAAHGWYGNGVRISCWEDFVLSEGVVTYMAARALEESSVDLWPQYDCELARICESSENTTALLDTCGEIDLINHELWSGTPYQKGAQYMREVAGVLGVDVVDQALSEFYLEHVGKSARMRDLVELLKSKGSADEIEALTVAWLETEACPASAATLCP